VKDLRRVAGSDPRFPQPLFVFVSEADPGAAFLDSTWPGARGIADPAMRLYDAFDVGRGGIAEMFGPTAFVCGIRATLKGNFIGRKSGDPWTLPAVVLADGGRVLWRHDGAHAGDHPDWFEILEQVTA
jgi:hypothetical protein